MTRTVTEIVELRVYPIKSCRGVTIDETTLTRQGLALDRRWMFVNASNTFLTIRNNPRFTLINTALADNNTTLRISIHGGTDSVSIPVHPSATWLEANTTPCTVEVWGTQTDAHRYGPAINDLFSAFLDEPVALVLKGPTPRLCGGNGAKRLLGRDATVNFPDVLPLQIASRASLAELNARLGAAGHDALTIERFRPNIIVTGTAPWSEDTWKTVRVADPPAASSSSSAASAAAAWLSALSAGYVAPPGAIDIDVVARCARCQVPNVNPDTAAKHKKQPWDTLVSYRRVDPGIKFKPCFGMLACPRSDGPVRVGMRLEVLEQMGEGRWKGQEHVYEMGF